MRILLLVLLISCSFITYGQDTLKLYLDNPQPRVGDEVKLTFDISFISDQLIKQSDKRIDFVSASSNTSRYSQNIVFKEPGEYVVGPYYFVFEEKKYLTDSIEVSIIDELPFEEGIWVRYVQNQVGNYVIVEQLIGNKSDLKTNEEGYSYTVGGVTDQKFVEIKENVFANVEIRFSASMSNTRREEGADIFAPGLSYSIKKYKVTFQEGFENKVVLKKKHFKDFPENIDFKSLEINP